MCRQFWTLDKASKEHFIGRNTIQIDKLSKRTKSDLSRQAKAVQYFFNFAGRKVHVCNEYFCSTLDISHQPIKYFYKVKKDHINVFVKPSQWGSM